MSDASQIEWPDPTSIESFREAGYMIIKGALNPQETDSYRDIVDEMAGTLRDAPDFDSKYREAGSGSVRIRNAIGFDPRLIDLVDHPSVFPALMDTVGPYLRLVGSEAFVREASKNQLLRFHTDGGPSMQPISVDPEHRALQVKIQYFLTDLSEPDSGNFTLVRGSHRQVPSETTYGCFVPEANEYLDKGTMPPNSIQIIAEPGDAAIFPFSTWHAVAPNTKGTVRKSVILRYGQLWHQPFDYASLPDDVLGTFSERQRRILGDLGPEQDFNSWYKPPRQLEIMK